MVTTNLCPHYSLSLQESASVAFLVSVIFITVSADPGMTRLMFLLAIPSPEHYKFLNWGICLHTGGCLSRRLSLNLHLSLWQCLHVSLPFFSFLSVSSFFVFLLRFLSFYASLAPYSLIAHVYLSLLEFSPLPYVPQYYFLVIFNNLIFTFNCLTLLHICNIFGFIFIPFFHTCSLSFYFLYLLSCRCHISIQIQCPHHLHQRGRPPHRPCSLSNWSSG